MKELLVEISYNCNFNCIHCSSIGCNNKLSLDRCKSIDLSDVTTVRISGGEPLLNKDIHEYINYFRNTYEKIILQTNGSILPSQKVLRNLDEIWVSLYGNNCVHEFVTRDNLSFVMVDNFIRNYKDVIPIVIQTPIFSDHQLKSAIFIARQYEVPIRLSALVNQGRCNFALSHKKQIQIVDKIKSVYNKIIVPCSLTNDLCYYNNKIVMKPDGVLFNCATHKHGKTLCKR